MRSFLTMLGIIIGIASIIAIVSTIKGTSEQIKEDLIGSGNNTVSIDLKEGDSSYDPEYGSSSSVPLLTQEIKNEVLALDHVENATFFYSRSYSSSVYYQNTSLQGGKVYGIDQNYFSTCGYTVQSGRGFVEHDFENYSKVAILDANAAETLMPGENAVGKTIEINQEPYTVVGVVCQSDDYQPSIESIDDF
jgi:putative ABC transport system permease protein